MKRNLDFILKIVAAALLVVVSVLWLLSAVLPQAFGGLSLAFLIAVAAFGIGILFIVRGAIEKTLISLRKWYVIFGVIAIIGGVCALIGTFYSAVIALPIIAVVLSAGCLVGTLFVRGDKWDKGDNQKAGYKNYYQRKEEENKANGNNAEEEK